MSFDAKNHIIMSIILQNLEFDQVFDIFSIIFYALTFSQAINYPLKGQSQ